MVSLDGTRGLLKDSWGGGAGSLKLLECGRQDCLLASSPGTAQPKLFLLREIPIVKINRSWFLV